MSRWRKGVWQLNEEFPQLKQSTWTKNIKHINNKQSSDLWFTQLTKDGSCAHDKPIWELRHLLSRWYIYIHKLASKPKASIIRIIPIGSKYCIFYLHLPKNQPNVGKYTTHGRYGSLKNQLQKKQKKPRHLTFHLMAGSHEIPPARPTQIAPVHCLVFYPRLPDSSRSRTVPAKSRYLWFMWLLWLSEIEAVCWNIIK